MLPCHKPGNLQLSRHSPRPAAVPGQTVCSPRGHSRAVVFSPFGRLHDPHCPLQRWDSPYTVSRESAGTFSCRYQLKDDNNQENSFLPSDARYLHVDDGDGSGEGTLLQGPAIPLWVWILCSALVLLLLTSAPIVTCIQRKRAIAQYDPEGSGWNGREKKEGEVTDGSGCLPCPGQVGGLSGISERSVVYAFVQKPVHEAQGE
ncbi:unnamed protein product [Natator depressus]